MKTDRELFPDSMLDGVDTIQTVDEWRHIEIENPALERGARVTLCGHFDQLAPIELGCDCGSHECKRKANCPACLQIQSGRFF